MTVRSTLLAGVAIVSLATGALAQSGSATTTPVPTTDGSTATQSAADQTAQATDQATGETMMPAAGGDAQMTAQSDATNVETKEENGVRVTTETVPVQTTESGSQTAQGDAAMPASEPTPAGGDATVAQGDAAPA